MSAHSRLLVLVVMSIALQAKIGHALPPIEYFGKVSSTYRLNRPSEGVETQSLTNTYELGASSYIWEPWFGLWRATGAVSRADAQSDQDTTAHIMTGDVQVNLFHRSRFPFTAFASIRDSRVEIEDLTRDTSDIRTLRLGLMQQYQDIDNGIFYLASLDHDRQKDLSLDEETTSNRLLLSADKSGQVHSLNGVLTVNQTMSTLADGEFVGGQATVVHNYRPTAALTINNHANASTIRANSIVQESEARIVTVGSLVEWRPSEMRLRLRGEIDVGREESTNESVGGLATDQYRNTFRGRASARYELSDEAVVFGEVGADRRESESAAPLTTFQSLSATYTSKPIDWQQYAYSWNAGAGVGNSTASEEDSVQTTSLSAGHAVTRSWVPDLSGPTPIVFSVGQDARFLNQTDEDTELQVTHRANLSATRATAAGTSYGQIAAFDVRTFGRLDTELFSLNIAANHNQALSRYRNLDLVISYNYNASTTNGVESEADVTSIEFRYRDSRLFDVNRLSFESRLRGGVTDLYASSDRDREIDLEWDNRLNYRIGMLEIDTRAAVTQTEERRNLLLILSLTRRF